MSQSAVSVAVPGWSGAFGHSDGSTGRHSAAGPGLDGVATSGRPNLIELLRVPDGLVSLTPEAVHCTRRADRIQCEMTCRRPFGLAGVWPGTRVIVAGDGTEHFDDDFGEATTRMTTIVNGLVGGLVAGMIAGVAAQFVSNDGIHSAVVHTTRGRGTSIARGIALLLSAVYGSIAGATLVAIELVVLGLLGVPPALGEALTVALVWSIVLLGVVLVAVRLTVSPQEARSHLPELVTYHATYGLALGIWIRLTWIT